jgi:hypothetical protein
VEFINRNIDAHVTTDSKRCILTPSWTTGSSSIIRKVLEENPCIYTYDDAPLIDT